MAKSSSSSKNEACCSKSCRKNTEDLNTKIIELSEILSDRLPEFINDTITDYSRPSPSIESNSSDLQRSNSSVFEHGESSKSIMSKPMTKFVKAADCLGVIKNNKTETVRKSPVKYAEMYKNTTKSLKVKGNQRNWNNLMNQRLASNFEFKNKACYKCGSFDHLIKDCSVHQKQEIEKPVWNNARRVNHQNSPRITHPNLKIYMALRKNLTRSGPISFNTARQSHLNDVCCCFSKQVNNARPKAVINWFNDVKASACWVWKPIKPNTASITLKRYDYVDIRGRSRNLFPPLDNPELTIQRRSRTDPTLLNNSEMATEGNGNLPVPDLRTMEELCQPSLNGREFNQHFEKMTKMFLGKYFPPSMVTKLRNEITNFRQHLDESLFKAWERYKISIDRCHNHNMLPVTQIDTFYNGLTLRHRVTINAVAGGTFMKRRPEECYDLIENMTAYQNDWETSAQLSKSSSSITSSSDTEIASLKAEMAKINKNLMRVLQVNQQMKAVTPSCETCGGPHSFNDCPATVGNTQNVYAAGAYQVVTTNEYTNFMKANDAILKNMQTNMTSLTNSNLELKNMFGQFMKMNTASSSGSRTLLGNIITNPKEDLKGITTRSGTAYQGPTIPTTFSSSLVVEHETEATKDTVHPVNNRSTEDVQPLVVPTESPILNSEPVINPIIEPVASPVSAPEPNQKPSIPYLSRLHDQKLRDKANDQREKFFQIFKDLNFNISFADALILMPKFGPSIKTLLTNKDKLSELARTPLNEHYLAVLLKKLPKKLGDPELADRSISCLVGVAEDVFVKVGTFHFPADFVVVDFDADPRVPLILRRSFLKTGRALIDVFEEYSQEVLGFFDVIASGTPTPYYDLIVSTTSLTLTLFENSDFLLKEVDAFLALEDDLTLLEVDQSYVNTEGDILLFEAFLNDDPSLPPPNQGNYLPQVRKELQIYEAKSDKSFIDEPLEVELKDLPPHLEYVFLEGDDKLPFITAKYLSVEEKIALITVLKSHKRAIA
nr:reverse transcriptase domain-containing protein [Tanacetum cinerariifolium]